jgi:hypothetical protein
MGRENLLCADFNRYHVHFFCQLRSVLCLCGATASALSFSKYLNFYLLFMYGEAVYFFLAGDDLQQRE